MISEREIAEKFSAIWKQHLPLLTANYMKVFNESQIIVINISSAPILDEVRFDLISEVAFKLAEIIIQTDNSPEEYLSDNTNVSLLLEKASRNIWKISSYSKNDLLLSKNEFSDTVNICNNIIEFISILKVDSFQFRPRLKGYSFIAELEADLEIDNTLYEIKTVNRNFKSNDLKQLFLYLALKQVSSEVNWKYGGLYNPRKGTYCKFEIATMISALTGGKTPNEAFDELLINLSRDIQIDSTF